MPSDLDTERQKVSGLIASGINIYFSANDSHEYLLDLLVYLYKNNRLYEDKDFPPKKQSLQGKNQPNEYNGEWENVYWERASKIFKQESNYSLFESVTANYLSNGSLGDVYLLCSLACLSEKPDLIRRLFAINQRNEYGLYAVWLNVCGIWRIITQDDFLPVYPLESKFLSSTKTCKFAFAKNEYNDLWVQQIEKAYAKVFGCYYNINGGDVAETLRDLTGCPYECFHEPSKNKDLIWEKIKKAHMRKYLITAVTSTDSYYSHKRSDGLISGRAYCILDLQEVIDRYGRPAKILKIRNPWDRMEWAGDWGDESMLWTEELRQQLNVVKTDDGQFWMSIDDVVLNFNEIGILKLHNDYYHNAISLNLKGQKDPFQIVKMSVPTNTHIFLAINQQDARLFPLEQSVNYNYSYFRVSIAKVDKSRYVDGDKENPDFYGLQFLDCKLSADKNIFLEYNLDAGEYVILIQPYLYSNLTEFCSFSTLSRVPGVSISQVRKFSGNSPEVVFQSLEYLFWKSFTRNNQDQFSPKGLQTLREAGSSVYQHTLETKVKEYGVIIDSFANTSNLSYFQKWAVEDCQGFTIIPRVENDVVSASCSKKDFLQVIMKMDPRSARYSMKKKIEKEYIRDEHADESYKDSVKVVLVQENIKKIINKTDDKVNQEVNANDRVVVTKPMAAGMCGSDCSIF